MASINVALTAVTVGLDPKNAAVLNILVELGPNPKLNDNQRVLGFSVETYMIGFLLHQLLHTLNVPTLDSIRNTPAVLDLEENDWTLINFLDETKIFNAKTIIKAVEQVVNSTISNDSTSESSESTTQ
jgi:hypothetical protein